MNFRMTPPRARTARIVNKASKAALTHLSRGDLGAFGDDHNSPLIDHDHIQAMAKQMGTDAFLEAVEFAVDELATRVAKLQKRIRKYPADGFEEQVSYMSAMAMMCGMAQLTYVLSRFGPDKVNEVGMVSPAYITRLSAVADESFRRVWDSPVLN